MRDATACFAASSPCEHDAIKRDANTGEPVVKAIFTLAINVETEEEVGAALQSAVEAGASLVKPATRADWGGLSGYFADPDGFLWEIAWNPGFPIDADGRVQIP